MSPLININVNDLAIIKQVRHALNWILCGVSGFTLAAISVDRLLALSLGLRYMQTCNIKASSCSYNLFLVYWSFSSIDSHFQKQYRPQSRLYSRLLVTSSFCYTRIFLGSITSRCSGRSPRTLSPPSLLGEQRGLDSRKRRKSSLGYCYRRYA